MQQHALPDPDAAWLRAPCGLLSADGRGLIVRANETFCHWLGYRRDELEGTKRFIDLLPMGARLFHQTHWLPLLQMQGSIAEVQLDLVHRDGRRIPMLLNALRRDQDGVQMDDIGAMVASDRKKYERELLDARQRARTLEAGQRQLNDELAREHRRKDEFIATLAHELRNPLAPIANVLEVLRLRPADDELWRWSQDVLERQLAQLTHLVDDLLEVSRITQGKLVLRSEPVLLADILAGAAEAVLPAVTAARQKLTIGQAAVPLTVHGDRTRLTQIVCNLLNNASKFTPEGGAIGLAAREADGMAVIEVSDTGAGIPAGQLERIFDMFSQLHPPLERSVGGLGIGLALVKGLTVLHGGTVSARSAGLGHGSVFQVTLPLASQPAAAPPLPDARTPGGKARLLVIDDNVDACDTLVMALDMLGHAAHGAHTGAAGLAALEQGRPDCALVDIGLPDIDGYELARRVRATPWGRAIVLIAVTGWGQDSDKRAAMEAGFDAHFTKPIDFTKLDGAIAGLLGRRSGTDPGFPS
ncbi:hybrid sensor histidine kinase/response regulator [Pseudoduganella chitinolytica]|uniref:histidine kinase n=1 Tax=Pseudoduganella chitinolytica TaxID=34070 RepID=A0ABY8B9E8_9BURK|nr:hybrid sensor histidine kinase/response regulator [Pseudoduganella chitinolytica]WEF32351.1 hybrid sensor histidine kinase/response regulator [Pseudoduganella chitinolytica]